MTIRHDVFKVARSLDKIANFLLSWCLTKYCEIAPNQVSNRNYFHSVLSSKLIRKEKDCGAQQETKKEKWNNWAHLGFRHAHEVHGIVPICDILRIINIRLILEISVILPSLQTNESARTNSPVFKSWPSAQVLNFVGVDAEQVDVERTRISY